MTRGGGEAEKEEEVEVVEELYLQSQTRRRVKEVVEEEMVELFKSSFNH